MKPRLWSAHNQSVEDRDGIFTLRSVESHCKLENEKRCGKSGGWRLTCKVQAVPAVPGLPWLLMLWCSLPLAKPACGAKSEYSYFYFPVVNPCSRMCM